MHNGSTIREIEQVVSSVCPFPECRQCGDTFHPAKSQASEPSTFCCMVCEGEWEERQPLSEDVLTTNGIEPEDEYERRTR